MKSFLKGVLAVLLRILVGSIAGVVILSGIVFGVLLVSLPFHAMGDTAMMGFLVSMIILIIAYTLFQFYQLGEVILGRQGVDE